jgi:alpha-galactosidase/6-phospho-beta-glucosidase family protein
MVSVSGAKPIALFSLQKTAKQLVHRVIQLMQLDVSSALSRRRRLSGKSTIGRISLCVLRDGRFAASSG